MILKIPRRKYPATSWDGNTLTVHEVTYDDFTEMFNRLPASQQSRLFSRLFKQEIPKRIKD